MAPVLIKAVNDIGQQIVVGMKKIPGEINGIIIRNRKALFVAVGWKNPQTTFFLSYRNRIA